MTMTDPIADMLTRIRNAHQGYKDKVEMPSSKLKESLAAILKAEGYVSGLKRISKPGLRVYTKSSNVPRVLGGLGIAVLSTSKGLMTDREARRNRMGGEILCYVW